MPSGPELIRLLLEQTTNKLQQTGGVGGGMSRAVCARGPCGCRARYEPGCHRELRGSVVSACTRGTTTLLVAAAEYR